MKRITMVIATLLLCIVSACNSTPSLQQYYVTNSENPNFLTLDLPVGLLNIREAQLSPEQKESLGSLKKLNVLAFKKTEANQADFLKEQTIIKSILKSEDFTELMKMNTDFGRATIKYLGDEDAIDEVVIYGDNEDKGFLVVRVLGKNMNPAKMIQFVQALEKSEFKGDELSKVMDFMK
ncbi:DUF4252 domain-containing protein [Zobellia laminariae]|uniref:DUF4252 domain-containing protein n=1 Tax=Zobellia laminariae TaxID=248906 RepID=UPI0012D92671|nr:DUF4252 domain-containing protein [Zobellia laminariae]MUH40015.1 DUF4252 domain-containing protein [Zobellia laminariae]WKX75366.1 DUF4252 domain-containing protein [Zobellia laminariae]